MANNQNKPILGIKCAKCGAVYMAHALAYPITQDIAEEIAYCVSIGDIPFITYEGVKLSICSCDNVINTTKEDETEG